MEVSSSSNSMEGIEGFQGSSNAMKVIQDSYDLGYNRMLSSIGPMSHSFLIEESIEPSPSECEAYEKYLNLSELAANWKSKEWLDWPSELLIKPALQSLEMTFRLISSTLCDTRPYIEKGEWKRRLESLTGSQLELISMLCEGDKDAPIVQLSVSDGVLATKVAQEVWQRPGALPVVSRISEESLLPRLGTWKRAEHMVSRIWLAIECHMQRAPFTLGLGEPNLSGKPILEYDKICKPSYLYSFKQSTQFHNAEDHTLRTVHQIFEAWLFIGQLLLKRIHQRIDCGDSVGASKDCWMIERIWKLLTDIQNMFLLVDPDDFLRLKHQLSINMDSGTTSNSAYCLKSTALRSLTDACKELRHLLPNVMGVEADPKGGPRLQEAVMHLFHSHRLPRREIPDATSCALHYGTIHLLLAFQAIEGAVKRFFFSYQQLVILVMGSVEMNGAACLGASDPLTQIYSEPPYFPSVDGAKTFLSDYWYHSPITMIEGLQKPVGKTDKASRRLALQSAIP
ncbi:hypothetical protein KI387_004619 [Taxus chinensis]|uniref:Uncharacterized protein n=1 Tax=Taxus chinensis TaxID=29808 RepID=A0AA38LI30_TAXCH|nr:hypothetical protein KI387_004619 [Taxus chinensis]